AFGLVGALVFALIGAHVADGGAEDLLCMIAQRPGVHLGIGQYRAREDLPFFENGFNVGHDESGESHQFFFRDSIFGARLSSRMCWGVKQPDDRTRSPAIGRCVGAGLLALSWERGASLFSEKQRRDR